MQSPRCRFVPRSFQLDLVVLDQCIREQLVGRLLERGFRLLTVAAFELDVEHLALAHAGDAVHTQRLEGTLDRLALRIENAGFERDGDASLHVVVLDASNSIWPESVAPQALSGRDCREFRHKPPQCTGAVACATPRRPPATCPLSPPSRNAAQNAACVLETTGMSSCCSSGAATPRVRKPPQEISSACACGASPQTLVPSAMMSFSLLLPG